METKFRPESFTTFTAIAVPIDIQNCDTDQIIPARFLRRPETDPNYKNFLLHDLRFNEDETKKDFIFNREPFCRGRIFVADINWGCGSSREHAAQALTKNGIRAVIAPSFGDIHYNNCIKLGILPIRLSTATCTTFRAVLHETPGAEITIDLELQKVTGPKGTEHTFEIDSFDKHRLIKGLDDIGLTMELESEISKFVESYENQFPWSVSARPR